MTTHVILIAVEKYDGDANWNMLKGPVSDARAFASWLTGKGVDPANLHVRMSAHDTPAATASFQQLGAHDIGPATRDSLRALFQTELPQWSPGELIVFWSGHGWFGENTLCLSASQATHADMHLIAADALLTLLRSDKAQQFKIQTLFFDACAKFMKPGDTGADRYVAGKPLEEISQNSFFAASPGQGAVETKGAGHFNGDFWGRLVWPFQPKQIRGELEDNFDATAAGGRQPFTIGFSLGKASEPTWRGVRPRSDALSGFLVRAGLTPRIFERLAEFAAACPGFATPESRDRLAAFLAQAAGRPCNRGGLRDDALLDFQFIAAFATKYGQTTALLQQMAASEATLEYADLEEYAAEAPALAGLVTLAAELGIPARVWRAWINEYCSFALPLKNELEDLFEAFFLSANRASMQTRLLQVLTRAYKRQNSPSLLAWLRSQPAWTDAHLAETPPQRQIVHLQAEYSPARGVWVNDVKLWRPHRLPGSYQPVSLAELGLDPAQILDLDSQFEALDQELTAKGFVAPDIPEIVYELALPAEALNAPRCQQPKHAVAFRWRNRLETRDRSMGTGAWDRFGEVIRQRANDKQWKPRAKWLVSKDCCIDETLQHLRGKDSDACEVIGLAWPIGNESADLAGLLQFLKTGVPFGCWHIDNPESWDPLEPEVQKWLDKDGLDALPLSLRNDRRRLRSLVDPMVVFFDDPRRNPYSAQLPGMR